MGIFIKDIAVWLGKNPEVLIFILAFGLGFVAGKR